MAWQTPAGESQAVVSSLDILPTALAAAGLEPPADKPLDGRDLLPLLLTAAPAPPRNLFWTTGGEEGWWAVRSGDWKLTAQKEAVSLFDLSKDVSETTDLAKENPGKVTELTALMDTWLAGMAPPISGEAKRFGLERTTEAQPKRPKNKTKKKERSATSS